jgi:hypothetical protein
MLWGTAVNKGYNGERPREERTRPTSSTKRNHPYRHARRKYLSTGPRTVNFLEAAESSICSRCIQRILGFNVRMDSVPRDVLHHMRRIGNLMFVFLCGPNANTSHKLRRPNRREYHCAFKRHHEVRLWTLSPGPVGHCCLFGLCSNCIKTGIDDAVVCHIWRQGAVLWGRSLFRRSHCLLWRKLLEQAH